MRVAELRREAALCWICVCVCRLLGVFRACPRKCVRGLLSEEALVDVCILAGRTVFALGSMSMHACTKGDASLCAHTATFFYRSAVRPEVTPVKDAGSPTKTSQNVSVKSCKGRPVCAASTSCRSAPHSFVEIHLHFFFFNLFLICFMQRDCLD